MSETRAHVERLHEDLGDALRGVVLADIRDREFDVLYMREDVWDMYEEETQRDIFEDAVFEALGRQRQEDLFEPLGDLRSTVRVFDYGINVMAWEGRDGVFVGLGPDEDAIPPAVRTAEVLAGK